MPPRAALDGGDDWYRGYLESHAIFPPPQRRTRISSGVCFLLWGIATFALLCGMAWFYFGF
jgi:hypothetical protein